MPGTNLPLVSIITAFLNVGDFLSEAIESVRNQTYTNWELILVDDGSTDESTSIAQAAAAANPDRVKYAEHEKHANRGVCASRNLAITLAKGDYLAFLDGDDVWFSNKLEAQMQIFRQFPQTQLLCEAAEYWYYAETPATSQIIQVGTERDRIFWAPELIYRLCPLSDGQAPCPSGIVVRKTAVTRNGGFVEHFTGKYQMYEDQAFLVKMYLNESVYISSTHHHRYRQRRGSLVADVNTAGTYREVRLYFLEWMKNYLKEKQSNNAAVQKLLNKAFAPYRRPYLFYLKKLIRNVGRRLQGAAG